MNNFIKITFFIIILSFYNSPALAYNSDLIVHNNNLRNFVSNYSDILLFTSCIFFIISGTIASFFYPNVTNEIEYYSKTIKTLFSVTGGLLSFFYHLEENNEISPIICLYVTIISFVSPIIFYLIHIIVREISSLCTYIITSKVTGLKSIIDNKK